MDHGIACELSKTYSISGDYVGVWRTVESKKGRNYLEKLIKQNDP